MLTYVKSGPEVIKLFSCSTQLSMKCFLLININMPTIVGILTFISRKNSILGLPEFKKIIYSYLWTLRISCSVEFSMEKVLYPWAWFSGWVIFLSGCTYWIFREIALHNGSVELNLNSAATVFLLFRNAFQFPVVGCFGFDCLLRQYFSLYRAVSQRGRKKTERIDKRKNVQTSPTRTYCKRNRPLPYYNPN